MFIDAHSHYFPDTLIETLRPDALPGVRIMRTEVGSLTLTLGSVTSRPFFDAMTSCDKRMNYLLRHKLDRQIVANWVDVLGYDLPEASAVQYCRLFNQALSSDCKGSDNRLYGLATVPLQYPQRAAEVLGEAVSELNLIGVQLGTNVMGRQLDDVYFDSFWRRVEQLDVPVVLHPVNVIPSDRISPYYIGNLIGNPLDTTIAATRMILGGVFDRFPKLKVLLLHGGGYLLFAKGRLEHGRQKRSEVLCERTIDEYLQRNVYVDTVVFDPPTLKLCADLMGPDRLLLGTDAPFDMAQDEAVDFVLENLPSITDQVTHINAQKLFGLSPVL